MNSGLIIISPINVSDDKQSPNKYESWLVDDKNSADKKWD